MREKKKFIRILILSLVLIIVAGTFAWTHWKSDGSPIGDFWVIDQDGWAYWAAPLNSSESTGLLLNKVSQTTQSEQYCITLSKNIQQNKFYVLMCF